MKYEIIVDAYGPRISKCFHKVIEADSQWVADNTADFWCDSLMDETSGEFDEYSVISVDEYTDTEHEVGDCWENEIEHDDDY